MTTRRQLACAALGAAALLAILVTLDRTAAPPLPTITESPAGAAAPSVRHLPDGMPPGAAAPALSAEYLAIGFGIVSILVTWTALWLDARRRLRARRRNAESIGDFERRIESALRAGSITPREAADEIMRRGRG